MPVISTNTAANSALRYLNSNNDQSTSAMAKLAYGSRITKASDDAAGLAAGTSLNSDVTILSQAATNASQATSLLQIADGGQANIGDMLQRMRSLATESISDTVTDPERKYISEEFDQLTKNINSVATGTRYNGHALLDGSFGETSFQVGTSANDKITVSLGDFSSKGLGIDTLSVSTKDSAQTALNALNDAVDTVSAGRASVGAMISRFDFRGDTIRTTIQNTSAAASTVMDADVASEKAKLNSADVKTQAAIAALTQANQMPQELLKLLV